MLKKYAWFLVLPMMFAFPSFAIAQMQKKSDIPCKIIRQIRYPVTQTEPYKQPLRIALLNLCPANPGAEARPMMSFFVNGKPIDREYTVEKVFKNVKEAKKYAKKNKIEDASY